MGAKEEIAAAIEEVRHIKQKDPSKTRPFEHDAVFNMLLSSIRKTSDDRKTLQWYPISESSAKKNELAEDGYWGENWQWMSRSHARKGWVDIGKIAGRLEKVLDDLTFLESRLEFYTGKLDGIVGKI
jgi:hypothetical protein